MKRILLMFIILILVLNTRVMVLAEDRQDNKIHTLEDSQKIYIGESDQANIELIRSKNNLDTNVDVKIEYEGYIDIDYWLDKIPGSNVYLMYATIKSDNFLTNYIKGEFSVKDTSILFPKTYMSKKSISKAYTATKIHTQYIGSFNVSSDIKKVKIVQENLEIYNLTKASWVSFGTWSGTFYLPEN